MGSASRPLIQSWIATYSGAFPKPKQRVPKPKIPYFGFIYLLFHVRRLKIKTQTDFGRGVGPPPPNEQTHPDHSNIFMSVC